MPVFDHCAMVINGERFFAKHMCLHNVKADGKQMKSIADGALDPWSCLHIFYLLGAIYLSHDTKLTLS